MSTLSRKEFKEQMNSLREEMHSMRADLGVQMHSMQENFNGQMHSMRADFGAQMHSMRTDFNGQINIFNANFNEKLSGYVTFSEKLEQARERERAERDKRLEALIQRSEINTERATRVAERAEEMAQKTTDGNRSYWLSTLTGVVATVLSVAALVVGAVYATQQSNSNSAQMALKAFQQGQHAASVTSVLPK